jgi:hypothetical protein
MDGVDDRNTSFLQDVVPSPAVNGVNGLSADNGPVSTHGPPMQNIQMQTNSGNVGGADNGCMPVAGNLSNGVVANGNAPNW